MKRVFQILTILLLVASCGLKSKSNDEMLQEFRQNFSEQAEVNNQKTLEWENLVDSIYKIADTNSTISLHIINSLISKENSLEYHKIIELHFIKGDIYYRIDSLQKSVEEFTKAGQAPKCLAARAGAYIKLKQFDNAITDLNKAAEVNSYYLWNIGNYYEIIGHKDSAIYNYTRLYNKDTLVYKYCQLRINELNKPKPQLLTELVYYDRQRMIILMDINLHP